LQQFQAECQNIPGAAEGLDDEEDLNDEEDSIWRSSHLGWIR
jgi:hypothetical protein